MSVLRFCAEGGSAKDMTYIFLVIVLGLVMSHCCGTMQALEARLDPARFVRVHRSAIVRLHAVEALHSDK